MIISLNRLNVVFFTLMVFSASMLQKESLFMKLSFVLLVSGIVLFIYNRLNMRQVNLSISMNISKEFFKFIVIYYLFFLLLYLTTIINDSNNMFSSDVLKSTFLNSLILFVSYFFAKQIKLSLFKFLIFLGLLGFLIEGLFVLITHNPSGTTRHAGFGGILQLGQDTSFALSLFMAYILYNKHINQNIAWYIYLMTFVFIYALYATGSRGPLIGLIISSIIVYLVLRQRFNLLIILKFIAPITIVFIALYFVNSQMYLIVNTIIDPMNDASNSSKILANLISVSMIIDNPFFGAGLGSFNEIKNIYIPNIGMENKLIDEMSVPHNMFLGIFAEAGVFVFLLYGYILIKPFFVYKNLFNIYRNENFAYIFLGLMGFLIVYNIDSLFHNYYTQNFIWVVIGFGYGILANKQILGVKNEYSTDK